MAQTDVVPIQKLQEAQEDKLMAVQGRVLNILPVAGDQFRRRFWEASLAIVRNPQLARCSTPSLLMAVLNCAKLGMIPDANLGHVYIVPMKNKGTLEANLWVGYKGRCELARRSGQITVIRAKVIYENDKFDYMDGLHQKLEHRPWWWCQAKQSGNRIGAYCVAEFKNGAKDLCVVTEREIMDSKSSSAGARRADSPWNTDPDAMAVIVPIRKAWRFWPQSAEMSMTDRLDFQMDNEGSQVVVSELESATGPIEETEDSGSWGFTADRHQAALRKIGGTGDDAELELKQMAGELFQKDVEDLDGDEWDQILERLA